MELSLEKPRSPLQFPAAQPSSGYGMVTLKPGFLCADRVLTRRKVLCTGGAAVVLSLAGGAWQSEAMGQDGTVYVFPFADIRPHALQKLLEGAMPGIEVTVFGRVGDFKRALQSSPPDAAVALAPVLEALGQRPVVQGTSQGNDKEKYLVLSQQDLDAQSLEGKTIGCFDLVGRRKLPDFVAKVLGLGGKPKVQRVTKVEDLLQLIQFKRADAILLPDRFLESIQSRTKMDLKVVEVPGAEVARTAMAFPGNRGAVEASLKRIPSNIAKKLGVDGWK